jgi:hypothetical protein
MKSSRVALLPALAIATLVGANLTGTWSLQWNPDFSGHRQTLECTFKQEQETLTIRCGEATMHGRVAGRVVTFEHRTGKKDEITARYQATLDENGTLMKGTWHLSAPENRDGKFEARKR